MEPGQYVPAIITKELFDSAVEWSNLPFAPRSAPPTPPPMSPPAPQSADPKERRVRMHISHMLDAAPPLARPLNLERSPTFSSPEKLPSKQRTVTPMTGYPPPVVPRGMFNSRAVPAPQRDRDDPWMPMDAQGRVGPVRQDATPPASPPGVVTLTEPTHQNASWPAAFPSTWSAGQSSVQRPAPTGRQPATRPLAYPLPSPLASRPPPLTATQPGPQLAGQRFNGPSSPPRSAAMDRTNDAMGRLNQVESRSTAGRHPRHFQPSSSGPSTLSVRGTGRTVPGPSRTRSDYERLHGLD
jgi:hypothetical protein